jgi:hypothetical protein
MIPRAWMISAAAVAILASGAIGYRQGYGMAEARMLRALQEEQQAVAKAAEIASRKEAERLAAEQERDALAQALEDQAYAEAVTGTCLPLSRVLRLRQR